MYALTSPITGGVQTGFTAPTYTHVADIAPDVNGKQVAVTALGGTQTGVDVHSSSKPFTLTFVRPKVFKGLGQVNPVTGSLPAVPKNVWKFIVRKGVIPLAGQPASLLLIETSISMPAGADVADPSNVRAALAAMIGALSQQSAGIGDSLASGLA